MPINPTTDDPNNINVNEIEVNVPNESIRIHYMDFHTSTSLSGPAFSKDTRILNGLENSYCYPETIKFLGHWRETGFIAKLYVIKTKLNTIDLLNKYLKRIPTYQSSTLDCAMYDYFLQVELKNGFTSTSAKTNKKCIFHLHRGFSRHYSGSKWYGDYFGTIVSPIDAPLEELNALVISPANNTVGIYEHAFKFGFNYSFRGNRFDNIYSKPYRDIDNSKIPPLKYLDIYESLSPSTSSKFEIFGIEPYLNYKSTFRLSNESELPPTFFHQFAKGIDYDELVFGNTFTFDFNEQVEQIDRASYSLNCYVKTIGNDKRVKDNSDNKYKYQTGTTDPIYSNFGSQIIGYFDLNSPNNINIQNRTNLYAGKVSLNTTLASSFINNNNLYARVSDINNKLRLICRYDIFDNFGSGYTSLSDSYDSENGIALSLPKKLRYKINVYFYDKAGENNVDDAPPPRFTVFLTDYKDQNSLKNNDTIKFRTNYSGRYGSESGAKINTFTFYYDLSTYLKIIRNNRSSNIQYSDFIIYDKDKDELVQNILLKSTLLKGFNKLITCRMAEKPELGFSSFDDSTDADVYFKGKLEKAFTYNRIKNLTTQNKDKFNKLVSINAPDIAPLNTANENDFINLNTCRFLKANLKLDQLDFNTLVSQSTANIRLSIWEPAGLGVTSRYFDRTIQKRFLDGRDGNEITFDLFFPDFPGKKYDDQDDPYPRFDNSISGQERITGPYYGCSRILRVDVNSDNLFSQQSKIEPIFEGNDTLRFNPPSGQDSNLKQYKAGDPNKLVRRLLLLDHNKKQEEEFDLIYDLTTKKSTLLKMSELVDNLNSNHFQMNCLVDDNAKDILATYTQGHHFYRGQDIDQALKIINKFYDDVNTVEDQENDIYYSTIYQGVFLDFPPFVQDFFEILEEDSWAGKENPKRKNENSDYHLVCQGTLSTRSKVFGIVQVDADNAIPRKPDLIRDIDHYQLNPFYIKDKIETSESAGEDGFYETGPLSKNYDFNAQTYDQINNEASFIFQGTEWKYRTKNLPNKATRIVFSDDRPYSLNTYVKNVSFGKNFFTAVGSKIDNQTSVLLGEAYDDLNPYTDITNRNDRNAKSGSCRIINISNSSSENSVSFYDISNIGEFNPRILNQNISNNTNYIIFAENYKYPSSGTAYTSQGIVYSNDSSNNANNWNYYNSSSVTARLFRNTERNSYQISPNFQDIYCLGDYNGALILQVSSLDTIKFQDEETAPNKNKSVFQVDGLYRGTDITSGTAFPEISSIYSRSAYAFKYSSIVCIDADILVFFYSLLGIPGLTEITNCTQLYFNTFINNQIPILGIGELFFKSSDFCNDPFAVISNYDFIYDNVQKLIKGTFMLSSFLMSEQGENYILYTEFDYNSGNIAKPNIFHFVDGNYSSTLFKSNVFYQDLSEDSRLIPFHKPAIYLITNNEQKGLIGIFYKDNNNNLLQKTLKFYSYTTKAILNGSNQ